MTMLDVLLEIDPQEGPPRRNPHFASRPSKVACQNPHSEVSLGRIRLRRTTSWLLSLKEALFRLVLSPEFILGGVFANTVRTVV